MNWVEIEVFTTTAGIEAVTGSLLGLGINGFVIKDPEDFREFLENKEQNWDYIDDGLMELQHGETVITAYLPENAQGLDYLEGVKAELKALRERDSEGQFGRLEYELKNVREEDWANNWKKYFKPLCVGEKILIKPSWEEVPENETRTILEIDPAASFGTGQHNTTQLCLELIEENLVQGDRILDLGCGSGILSIAALLLGADSAFAVDIDANSVKIALENAGKNNIPEERYTARCGNVIDDEALRAEIGSGYDMVCANIVADVLLGMAPIFGGFLKDSGRLVISGIIDSRKDEVLDAVKAQGFELVTVRVKDDWTAASFVKK
jgi:ribosomal protein L11 methyltransferase